MRKKVFYVPGLISSIGLGVVLLFFYIRKPPHYHRPHILRMVVPTDKPPDQRGFQIFSKYSFLRDIAKKTIHTVDLNEPYPPYDPSIFHLRQGFITREIERMQFTHDTSSILKIHFGENNTYGDFMWVLNQAYYYGFRHFAYFDDNFYLVANTPDKPAVSASTIAPDL